MDRPDLAQIRAAAEGLRPFVHRTPIVTSRLLDEAAGRRVFLKAECLQKAGSFKIRGAATALGALGAEARRAGVVAHSSGNHAQAVALAARHFGVDAVVVMPEDANRLKVLQLLHTCGEMCVCERCKGRNPWDVWAEDIIKLDAWVKERGMRTIMWGDQFLEEHTGGAPA